MFEDNKGVIISRNVKKDKQHSRVKMDNHDQQTLYKNYTLSNTNTSKSRVEVKCPERVGSPAPLVTTVVLLLNDTSII